MCGHSVHTYIKFSVCSAAAIPDRMQTRQACLTMQSPSPLCLPFNPQEVRVMEDSEFKLVASSSY